jgi:hypothetical protein
MGKESLGLGYHVRLRPILMLSNAQKWLCKRAQAQAALSDADYRDTWQTVAGVTSSTDPKLTDRQMDKFLALLEAIYWRKVDAGQAPSPQAIAQLAKDAAAIPSPGGEGQGEGGPSRAATLNPLLRRLDLLPFRARGFWANKNTKESTSRERFAAQAIASEIQELEAQLDAIGYGGQYCARILENISTAGPQRLVNYRAALRRTLNAKRKDAHAHQHNH